MGANPHHVPCASSTCRTRMPPPPPQAAGGRRGEQQGTYRTTTTRVSSTAGVITTSPSLALLHPSSLLLYGPVVVMPRKRLRLVNSCQQHFFLLLRHRMPACVPLSRHHQSSDLRACTSKPCAIRPSKRAYIFIYGLSSFSHMCLSRRFSISMRYTS